MTRIVLHDYFRSSASYRVRIALNLKGLSYEQHHVSLAKGEQKDAAYTDINPQGFVPMLEWDELRLTQSLAIFDFLDAQVKEPPFVPSDPEGRAHVLALALTIACDIHPLNNLRVLKYLKTELGQEQAAVDGWYRHWVEEGLAALEALAAPKAGRFLYGDQLSMADICLVPQLYNGRRFDVPMDAYPTLLSAEASALALPAFKAAHPDAQEVQS
ncbi:maleylacetoacetate isomerase [Sphingomonas sp. LHG3406-1]|uniref:maleylacetoacetate isomerase n=1 Tax=Sphingomonas sp. LHG3406-1 TaxID=2804617 RepID=UPI00262778EC|nr:maleylacetoacetate isomerase [Sphingomonas sp. LHG3406-1]